MPSGEHRPAIITRVWDNTRVNLQVFTDGENDREVKHAVQWEPSVGRQDVTAGHESAAPRTWHWPEREDEKPAAQTITGAGGIDAREMARKDSLREILARAIGD